MRAGPSFWSVVFVLLRAAQKRAAGRYRRHLRLNQKRGGSANTLHRVGLAFAFALAGMTHLSVGMILDLGMASAEQVDAEARGRIVVEEWFAGRTERHEADAARFPERRADITSEEDSDIAIEAPRLASRNGGDAAVIAAKLREVVRQNPKLLLSKSSLWWQPGSLADLVALIAVAWWAVMLICWGEGPGFDTQRPRYPMWEWLFSHPVAPSAVFLAEMIGPIATNPLYVTAPVLPAVLYGGIYGWPAGLAAAALAGVPAVIALACMSKAIQVWVILRFSPRARGAMLGVISWLGLAATVPVLQGISWVHRPAVVAHLLPLTGLPWPRTRLLVGLTAAGHYYFWLGIALCWIVAVVVTIAALALAVFSTRGGITGRSGGVAHLPTRASRPARWRAPLYQKEFLWLWRDRSVLVQIILLPVSLAAFQAFNLHQLFILRSGTDAWNSLCGITILMGTYFLLTVGPGSLASEGRALWIAVSWPHGLESLLRAKAKLWMALSSALVAIGLIITAVHYPSDIPSILLVAVLWLVFARSLADKTTTLATTVSSSGEPEKLPEGLRWAATLGTLTFSLGILTHQWGLAIAGVVYSIITAAAMWQTFRHRLPYLFDPWSQTLPPPPTLLHAMVAISAMIEIVAILSAVAVAFVDRSMLAPLNAAIYGLCAIAVSIAAGRFLAARGVRQRDIWLWRDSGTRPLKSPNVVVLIAGGAMLGAALGGADHIYIAILHQFPGIGAILDDARRQLHEAPHAYLAEVVLAVVFAPLAEEFLFRGLLYRALDSEWGGWRAVIGAAAFFAVYHPTLSWAPVAVLGAANAVLYKRTGHLTPAVAAHMAYNAVVVAF